MKRYLVLLLALALPACAASRGFDRDAMRSRIAVQDALNGEDHKNSPEQRPQLPTPFRLAIYFEPTKTDWEYEPTQDWQSQDKAKLLEITTELKKRKILSDVFVINESDLADGDASPILSAAARAGADAVLIVNGVSSIDRYNNFLGVSYFLIVTPLIVMGTEAEGLFLVNASLWDVRNRHLYLSAEAEGTARQTRPAFFIHEHEVIDEAKSGAIASLGKELSRNLLKISTK